MSQTKLYQSLIRANQNARMKAVNKQSILSKVDETNLSQVLYLTRYVSDVKSWLTEWPQAKLLIKARKSWGEEAFKKKLNELVKDAQSRKIILDYSSSHLK